MNKNVRRGFTLPEVLVTVTVVAVLAAVVVPAVTQYASKGDAPATKSDVAQLITAVTAFTSDIGKYPGDMRQLTTKITDTADVARDTAATKTTYSAADVKKWKGPYTPSTYTASGYATISGLDVVVGPSIRVVPDGITNANWLEVPIISIGGVAPDCVGIAGLDAAIDGTNTGATTGQVQWTSTGSQASGTCSVTAQTAKLRLIPAP
jgi:prepilin-type N-terminal cleavage/methylation domain-containing protein